jgi:hypothetical protein
VRSPDAPTIAPAVYRQTSPLSHGGRRSSRSCDRSRQRQAKRRLGVGGSVGLTCCQDRQYEPKRERMSSEADESDPAGYDRRLFSLAGAARTASRPPCE